MFGTLSGKFTTRTVFVLPLIQSQDPVNLAFHSPCL